MCQMSQTSVFVIRLLFQISELPASLSLPLKELYVTSTRATLYIAESFHRCYFICKLLKYFWYSVNSLLDQNYELIKMLYLQTATVMLLMATTINLPGFIGVYPHMVTFKYLPVE